MGGGVPRGLWFQNRLYAWLISASVTFGRLALVALFRRCASTTALPGNSEYCRKGTWWVPALYKVCLWALLTRWRWTLVSTRASVVVVPILPAPCASPALSKHGVGVEPLFLGIFGSTVFVVPYITWCSETFHRTLPPDDVFFDVILSHSCYFPSITNRHLHLRDLRDVGDHVCLAS